MKTNTTHGRLISIGLAGLFEKTAYSLFHSMSFTAIESKDESNQLSGSTGTLHELNQLDVSKLNRRAGEQGLGGCSDIAFEQEKAETWRDDWTRKAG